jgi:transcriptional repressor NrdR
VQCPDCRAGDTKVVDSRVANEGSSVRRRRQCLSCAHRFTTFERVEEVPLVVCKSDGSTEPFDRAKVEFGLRAATKGRDLDDDLDRIVVEVEDELRLSSGAETTSSQIGLAVLERLRSVDEVAYLRFASVYKHFDGAVDFHRELELLAKEPTEGRPADATTGRESPKEPVPRRGATEA